MQTWQKASIIVGGIAVFAILMTVRYQMPHGINRILVSALAGGVFGGTITFARKR